MVNFRDPAVILRDVGAHAFEVRLCSLMISSFNSDTLELLAHYKWSLYVGLFSVTTSSSHVLVTRTFLVGSSSQLLATSSISSEDVAPTGGLYGSVLMAGAVWLSSPTPETWTELTPW